MTYVSCYYHAFQGAQQVKHDNLQKAQVPYQYNNQYDNYNNHNNYNNNNNVTKSFHPKTPPPPPQRKYFRNMNQVQETQSSSSNQVQTQQPQYYVTERRHIIQRKQIICNIYQKNATQQN